MIDIENQVISAVSSALTDAEYNIKVNSDLTKVPSEFPCVYVVEADNYCYKRSIDSGSNENHVNVMYEVQCYTNDNSGKKGKCKKLFSVVDEVFLRLGFTRISKVDITLNNATVYRIVARYTAVVGKNNIIYRG